MNELQLDASQLTPEGARYLAQLPELEHLHVLGPGIDRTALARLKELPVLQTLWIHRADIGDDDLAAVATFPQLEQLSIASPNITDGAIRNLAPLRGRLHRLELIQSQIGDAGIEELADIFATDGQLEYLAIGGAGITDASLDDLLRFRSLRHLTLQTTSISDAGKAELQKQLPQSSIGK